MTRYATPAALRRALEDRLMALVRKEGGDVLREPYEILEGRDWFGFAGLLRARVPSVSREEQFAEKLHAYTLPRAGRPNSRVKDLVDLALLVESGTLNRSRLRTSVADTFRRRATHPVPSAFPPPPAAWQSTFVELAQECVMETRIEEHVARITKFYAEIP